MIADYSSDEHSYTSVNKFCEKATRAPRKPCERNNRQGSPLVPANRNWFPERVKTMEGLAPLFCRRMSGTTKKSAKARGRSSNRRWSARVTQHSDALDLESSVFKSTDPHRIALSLKRSAQRSNRRKGTPYQSAMSMLNFYINRAGKNLPQKQKRVLKRAKGDLRALFGRA